MTKILSFAPQWDILKAFYSDFDSGRKYGCVEKWQRKKFSSSLEIKLFRTKIHTEFLNDRQEKLNAEFRWTKANKEKLVALDRHFRKLHRNIDRTFEATKKDLAVLIAQKHKWCKEYALDAKICLANDWDIPGEHQYISDLLFWYTDWDTINIGASTNEHCSEHHKVNTMPAWKEMLQISEFTQGGVTWELDCLLYNSHASLYAFRDIIRMKPDQFEVGYTLTL